jgi:uncharacterized protein (DUF952 family)
VRWLYHVRAVGQKIARSPEGFVHCSYRRAVLESARLYFPADAQLEILQIDPRGRAIEVADTPRGPMPHVFDDIPESAVVRRWRIEEFSDAPDEL